MEMDKQLFMAARTGNINLQVKQLVEDDEANILDVASPAQANTALHMAARFGNKDLVVVIMNQRPNLARKGNIVGETPVHFAAKAGHSDVLLLFKGAVKDIARIRDGGGNTAVHCAVRNNHMSVLKLLVQGDEESLGLVNNAGESPLFIAMDQGLTPVANFIISENPSTLDHTHCGQTPLHRAVIRRDLGICLFLLLFRIYTVRTKLILLLVIKRL